MSEESATEETAEDTAEEKPSRAAGVFALLLLAGLVVLVLKAVLTAVPYMAYFVAGVLVCSGWHRARAWRRSKAGGAAEPDDEEELDVVEALRHLGRNGDHVLLTQLRKRLRVADTKAVKALLKEEGVRVRSGVRTPAGNGPGVHTDDIPAPPSPAGGEHGESCCCTSGPTTPTPTTGEEGAGEGLRVVALGHEAKIVYDPKDTVRHHSTK